MIATGKKSERWKCAMCEMQRLYYMCVVAAILLCSVTPGPLDAAAWLLYSFPQSSATQYLLCSPSLLPSSYTILLLCLICMYLLYVSTVLRFLPRTVSTNKAINGSCFVFNRCLNCSLFENKLSFQPHCNLVVIFIDTVVDIIIIITITIITSCAAR